MLASTRSSNSVRTISGKGAVFIEARVTEVTHHKGRIYVRSFTQLTFYTTESLGGLRNKRSTYMPSVMGWQNAMYPVYGYGFLKCSGPAEDIQ